ncbi:MAG: DUF2017 family protein [Actinobacteria bacterium]|uniref:Unannotated protein n=1 Tax=freshwater metagenome TaxID=449393 RepID=A0A6J6E775_9ZZZZ|nr:DUF2017 family protein [Actinomycetota bacterium]
MAHAFNRTLTGKIAGRLDPVEQALLRSLVLQLAQLLHETDDSASQDPLAQLVGIQELAERPEDPALLRLFPDAYRDDESAANDFRRYTQARLRETKTNRADAVIEILDRADNKIELSDAEAQSMLAVMNDTRLVLASRLGLTDELKLDELLLAEADQGGVAHLYEWLTWLQETLVRAIMQKN